MSFTQWFTGKCCLESKQYTTKDREHLFLSKYFKCKYMWKHKKGQTLWTAPFLNLCMKQTVLFPTVFMPRSPPCMLNCTTAQQRHWQTHWWRLLSSRGCSRSGWMLLTATRPWRTHTVRIWLLSEDTSGGDKCTTAHNTPVHLLTSHCPALRSGYVEEEADLPNLEDLQGAAKGLMRLQDVYSLQVMSLVRGQFQRITDGKSVDVYLPAVSVQLSGDDCFLVGKVHSKAFLPSYEITLFKKIMIKDFHSAEKWYLHLKKKS